MLTNDIKKGMRVKLRNGWFGTMQDSKRGNARMCKVEGTYTEIGSVYAWDILHCCPDGSNWEIVELTEKQIETREMAEALHT